MKDVLAAASAIAELHDMDRGLALVKALGAWRPEHDGACDHCGAALGAYLGELLARHQVSPLWLMRQLQRCGFGPAAEG